MPSIELLALTERELQHIVDGERFEIPGLRLAADVLPPPRVARRALDLLARGCPPLWALPFHIVTPEDALVVGGCGFKGAPVDGQVEIGYAIAPSCMRRGYGAAGVRALLERASIAGALEVVAHILPDNLASTALVRRLGFIAGTTMRDADGDEVIRWHWPTRARRPL